MFTDKDLSHCLKIVNYSAKLPPPTFVAGLPADVAVTVNWTTVVTSTVTSSSTIKKSCPRGILCLSSPWMLSISPRL